MVRVDGRVLYLTRDIESIRRQLAGEWLAPDPERPLLDNVSTDEMIPAWACYYYDASLARFCLVGLRGGVVAEGAVEAAGVGVLVAGESMGSGSSRETAPYAQRAAGVRVVVARSFETIYRQNCQNIGLYTTTDWSLLARLVRGEDVPAETFCDGADAIARGVVLAGGLFAYNRRRLLGELRPPPVTTRARPMTLSEKILAAHAVVDATSASAGVSAVAPGDSLFARADHRFSHDYVTAMAEHLFVEAFGADAAVEAAESVYAFRDHLTLLDQVMPEVHRERGLDVQARELHVVQQRFAKRHGIAGFTSGAGEASEGICHNLVIERLALPGELVVGTDSHTCMAGVLGCLAFGVGSTDIANAWYTRDVRVRVPPSVRVELTGKLARGVCAKDIMLALFRLPLFEAGKVRGSVLEFAGSGLAALEVDERATMTNMAVEAGAFTGIMEADDAVLDYLVRERGFSRENLMKRRVQADPDAFYAHSVCLDLAIVEPMVALPGDPRNAIPLRELSARHGGKVSIDIAYAGSCTGGKRADMDMYAAVLGRAVREGRGVAPGVRLFIQFGSLRIRRYAEQAGYVELFERAGAVLVEPSCGACIRAGPGVSERAEQVTVSSINRNYPGRSGPGLVYLANPWVVAASAVEGRIAAPEFD